MTRCLESIFILAFKIFAAILVSTPAFAGFDLGANGYYRSYPVSGVAEATLGYDQLIWGSEKNPIYGFTRIAGEFDFITQYQASAVKFEFFPVSFLGLRAGEIWEQNHQSYSSYDCVNNVCSGFFTSQYVEGQIYLGAGPFQFSGSYRDISKSSSNLTNPGGLSYYIDPESGLQFSTSQGDHLWRSRGVLVVQFNKNIGVGYSLTQYKSDISDEKSSMWLGFLKGNFGDFTALVGGGEFQSSLQLTHSTVFIAGKWDIFPKLGY